MKETDFTLTLSEQTGAVDATLLRPTGATAVLVLAHGAGAGYRHAHMQQLAESFAAQGLATLRFNFPYMQAGKPRTDNLAVCIECFAAAIKAARQKVRGLPVLLGGHSFGGRMASHYLAETGDTRVKGLICCSFPLHNPGKPETKRADHLGRISQPMLFLSGSRDAMAQATLLEPLISGIDHASLHWLDTGDHGFKILKRSRHSAEDIHTESARVALDWLSRNVQET